MASRGPADGHRLDTDGLLALTAAKLLWDGVSGYLR